MLGYQARVLEDKHPTRIIEKSRRVGITWALACEMALDAAEEDGNDGWYIGYNQDMSPEYIKDVAFFAGFFSLVCSGIETEEVFFEDDPDKAVLIYTIRFASGFKVSALSSKPRNLRNKRGHILIDEAAHHDQFDELLKAGSATEVWGGKNRITIVSTHQGVDNPFNVLVQDVRSGKVPMSLHRITIHDALRDGLYKRICLVNRQEWSEAAEKAWLDNLRAKYRDHFPEEFECVPSKSGGVYIDRDLIERAQVIPNEVRRLELQNEFMHWSEKARKGHIEDWCQNNVNPMLKELKAAAAQDRGVLHFLGVDFGRVSDRSVISVGQLTRKMKRRYPAMLEMLNVPFKQQEQVLFYVLAKLPRWIHIVLDSNGNGSYLAEQTLLKYGERRVTCAKITAQWYAEHLPPFKATFEDEQIELCIDRDHIIDLSAFQVVNGQPTLPKAKTDSTIGGPKRHGDAAISLLCADIASRQPISEYAYDTPKQEHTKSRDLQDKAERAEYYNSENKVGIF